MVIINLNFIDKLFQARKFLPTRHLVKFFIFLVSLDELFNEFFSYLESIGRAEQTMFGTKLFKKTSEFKDLLVRKIHQTS